METAIVVKTDAVEAKAVSAVEQARAMQITTPEEFSLADTFCVGLKEIEKEIIATFKEPKEKAWQAHKSIVAAEAKHLEPVQEARKLVKGKMSVYNDEQERQRRAEEKRLEDIRRKRAEDDALEAAEAAEKAGNAEHAEAILAAPVQVEPVVLENTVPKAQTVIRKVWTYRIVNEAMIPRAYLMPDTVKLGQQARATQENIKVPGVVFYQKPI